jgi:hypothetical protein
MPLPAAANYKFVYIQTMQGTSPAPSGLVLFLIQPGLFHHVQPAETVVQFCRTTGDQVLTT